MSWCFSHPHQNDTYYIKRVIGIPGDRVAYRNKQLLVNGEPVPQEWLPSFRVVDTRSKWDVRPYPGPMAILCRLIIAGDRVTFPLSCSRSLFYDGDNRDNSSDSRVWGQVPERDIVGKAVAIWMHWEEFLSAPLLGVREPLTDQPGG